MSKILLIGDFHLGLGFPNSHTKWFNVAKNYFEQFLLPLVKKELNSDDIIVQLGDLFDNRNYVPIDVLNYGQFILEELSKICTVHVLVGNHDMYNKSKGDINALNPFKHIPNVNIYDTTTKIDFLGKSILMMPYIEKRKEQEDLLKKYSGCDFLFCHSDLNGAKMHLTSIAHKNPDKIESESFSGFKVVRTGHIHIRQTIGHITFVGSTFQMDRNDLGNEKGIYIIDSITGDEKFIENKISPQYKKVYLRNEDDILNLDKISTKDYIDLFISNSLLINNRKLRRKLEMILEKGNFASVDYIDDLVQEGKNVETKSPLDDITEEELQRGVIPSIQLEYTELIRQYITNQKYENEKIKIGIIEEFNEVARIYDENFKSQIE